MNNIYEIKCFIASPSDTAEERKACETVFEEINHGLGRGLGFRIVSLRWEKDVYPSAADYTQQVINQQVEGNYDLFVGIMKSRFGTPTRQAGSGTEEEFNIAYEKFQNEEIDNIFFCFGIPDQSPYELDLVQFQKVKDFRKKIEESGVVPMQGIMGTVLFDHFKIIDYILCKQSDLWVERQTKYDKRRNKSNAQRYRE